jgi:hypothetical protein
MGNVAADEDNAHTERCDHLQRFWDGRCLETGDHREEYAIVMAAAFIRVGAALTPEGCQGVSDSLDYGTDVVDVAWENKASTGGRTLMVRYLNYDYTLCEKGHPLYSEVPRFQRLDICLEDARALVDRNILLVNAALDDGSILSVLVRDLVVKIMAMMLERDLARSWRKYSLRET